MYSDHPTSPPTECTALLPPTEDALATAQPVCDRGTLTMVNGPEVGSLYRLGRSTLIGRAPECQIRIDEGAISRRHALIMQVSSTDYLIEDLRSRNGTTVRGRLIVQSHLVDGDRIGLGTVFFRFALADEAEEVALRRRYESSVVDSLTGALNRKCFDDRLLAELAFAKRHRADLSLLLLDVDDFKRVNDCHGHQAGDAVLRMLAARVRSTLRVEDVFARYGGDEFAIIARGIVPEQTMTLAERVRDLVGATPFDHEGSPIPITLSVGMASLSACADASAGEIICLADSRLYAAKAAGRNCSR